MKRILQDLNAQAFKIYLTGSDNFRYKIYPEYKANRKDKPRPRHWNALKEHLIVQWDAEMTNGCEADDAIGVDATSRRSDGAVVCSIDKDLRQIPGLHYNFVKQELNEVDEEEADRNFWMQMLTGDKSDNVPGFPGFGTVGAAKLLESSTKATRTRAEVVLEKYLEASTVQAFVRNGKCLWIWRKEGDIWNPTEKLGLDLVL